MESTRGVLKRLAGQLRYDTADAVVQVGFKKSDWAVIASGESYPDALVASSLAGALDAPVILSAPNGLDTSAVKRIQLLGISKAVLVGGDGVLTSQLESQVKGLVSTHQVFRFGGANRYATSLNVLERAPSKLNFKWSDTVLVATGESYPDALSISPLAWKTTSPIVLVDKSGLNHESSNAISSSGFSHVLLAGGKSVVPESVAEELVSLKPVRLDGSDRYDTSVAIAKYDIQKKILKADGAMFATGENFPNALAGGSVAGTTGNVLMLVGNESSRTIDVAAELQTEGNMDTAYLLGGENAISNATAQRIALVVNKRIE